MKIALLAPDDLSLWLFRKGLIQRLIAEGHEVVTIARGGPHVRELQRWGARHIPVKFERFVSPRADLRLIFSLARIFLRERFDILHNFTIKPNAYAAVLARCLGVPLVVNSVTGLGALYRTEEEESQPRGEPHIPRRSVRTKIVRTLFMIGSQAAHRTWFQNPDDLEFCVGSQLITRSRCVLIRSSGIDTALWRPRDLSVMERRKLEAALGVPGGRRVVLMVARAMREKGVDEYLEAAERLSRRYPDLYFLLAGSVDDGEGSLTRNELLSPARTPFFRWIGHQDELRTLYALSELVVLPSFYREGVPRVLLEAMAMGRPIVTCDTPGCREVVYGRRNGVAIPPRSAVALEKAIEDLMSDAPLRRAMGREGRRIAESDFRESDVVEAIVTKLYGWHHVGDRRDLDGVPSDVGSS